MVVPRSSRKLAEDDEFGLFNVTVFKKVKEEFVQKCRENKWVHFPFDPFRPRGRFEKDAVVKESRKTDLCLDVKRIDFTYENSPGMIRWFKNKKKN